VNYHGSCRSAFHPLRTLAAWVRFRPIADIDRKVAAPHHPPVKRLLQAITLVSAVCAIACSNGQADSVPAKRDATATLKRTSPPVALTGRVTDAAHILSADQQSAISSKLERLEQRTKHQLVVVTVPTLNRRDVADFTRDLANSWGIGRKGYNDGIVLLVAPNEHKVRIAVGYGLEAQLTHASCQRIIDQQMLPHFRRGDLGGGVEAGADALISRLR
jgi:uncharacterized protein